MTGLSWVAIVRLGLVQTCMGAIIVLTTSTLNRIMVVELMLPAMLPGILVAIHHAVQMSRPRFGHGSDVGGRTTNWIIGGMLVLAIGGVVAAAGTALLSSAPIAGFVVCTLAFTAIGLGASASATSLLVTLAKHVAPHRKPAAATIVWIMMIAGFAVTAGVAGHFLDPFSPQRLLLVSGSVSLIAVVVTLLAVAGVEPRSASSAASAELNPITATANAQRADFRLALRQVWEEAEARRFTVFVFVSMLAYSAQDLILEPFAGIVFAMTPGESTQLSGIQHSGVLLGMLLVAATTMRGNNASPSQLRNWCVAGCLASAVALLGIACGGLASPAWPITANVFLLGIANGAFAVAAIASMMMLAGNGAARREGLRMGLWGAAQAIAFAVGGFMGTVAIDICNVFITEPAVAYALVFSIEGGLFVVAAAIGLRLHTQNTTNRQHTPAFGEIAMVEILDAR
ncbi:MAG: BCD family MFS transporter [Congregibacter sp.]